MTEQAYIQIIAASIFICPTRTITSAVPIGAWLPPSTSRGFSLDLVRSALFLATARRLARNPVEPPLPPVRSLHYFLPVLEEIKLQPPGYVQYLDSKVRAASLRYPVQISNHPRTGA